MSAHEKNLIAASVGFLFGSFVQALPPDLRRVAPTYLDTLEIPTRKAAVKTFCGVPFRRSWTLGHEVAGTSQWPMENPA